MTFFGKELVHFVEAMGLQQEIVDSLYKFDFSETKGFAFVHSMLVLSIRASISEGFCISMSNVGTAVDLTWVKNGDEQATAVLERRSKRSAYSMRVP